MGLGDMVNKAKEAISSNREAIEEQAGKLADSKLGDNAEKAKDALDKGLDKLVGED